ncbi:MAG: hypothetical protein AVDCRST_MAG37-3104 [uncultured Rubrobacteraceae bacterium]|uniref:Uncharacterized protein n=1 Tax=uncultured Rubrobacteraceae bacterium TaxID=349277 RepID=A0A6J4QW53_9ACTN|nr:MAG: hypothetical protein AVDCRST_MAG37-3104 [uncultured Rubrobacteraceae bacterium]
MKLYGGSVLQSKFLGFVPDSALFKERAADQPVLLAASLRKNGTRM